MQNKINYLEVDEKKYPLIFNLNVMEKIQEKFGSITEWGNLTDGKSQEVNIKALKFGVMEMINEGIDIENEKITSEKRNFVTEKEVGRIITNLGLQKMSNEVQNTVIDSTKVEDESKNV